MNFLMEAWANPLFWGDLCLVLAGFSIIYVGVSILCQLIEIKFKNITVIEWYENRKRRKG